MRACCRPPDRALLPATRSVAPANGACSVSRFLPTGRRRVFARTALPPAPLASAPTIEYRIEFSTLMLIGLSLGLFAYWRKSLRPAMLAHGLLDALGGIVVFFTQM